jgi:hypothetical protein
MKNTNTGTLLFWGMLSLYFVFIGYEVLTTDYLFTDEAYRLWHKLEKQDVFNDFHTQGRALGGAMIRSLFGSADSVTDIRRIRLLSLAECGLLFLLLFYALKRWQRSIPEISEPLIYFTVAAAAASLPVSNWVGWGVSVIIPVAAVLGLLAGAVLYELMWKGGKQVLLYGVVFVTGVASLFFYQSPYPLFLLPFYFRFLVQRDGVADRLIYRGIVYYAVIMGVYFCLFKLELRATGMGASSRTGLAANPLERLSFFFSAPMNQAFNGNLLFDAHSVFSQALFPVLLLVWLFLVFRYQPAGAGSTRKGRVNGSTRKSQVAGSFRYVLGMIVFWILGFLPQLAPSESDAPYRTMLVLTVMVLVALAYMVLERAGTDKMKERLGLVLALLLLAKGAYNYKTYLTDPLQYEYRIVQREVRAHYHAGVSQVIFILAPENGFKPVFGLTQYKDEFGLPSTYKDWTPEPLVKQLVYEMGGDRAAAAALTVTLYRSIKEVQDLPLLKDPRVLFVDMPSLLRTGSEPARR